MDKTLLLAQCRTPCLSTPLRTITGPLKRRTGCTLNDDLDSCCTHEDVIVSSGWAARAKMEGLDDDLRRLVQTSDLGLVKKGCEVFSYMGIQPVLNVYKNFGEMYVPVVTFDTAALDLSEKSRLAAFLIALEVMVKSVENADDADDEEGGYNTKKIQVAAIAAAADAFKNLERNLEFAVENLLHASYRLILVAENFGNIKSLAFLRLVRLVADVIAKCPNCGLNAVFTKAVLEFVFEHRITDEIIMDRFLSADARRLPCLKKKVLEKGCRFFFRMQKAMLSMFDVNVFKNSEPLQKYVFEVFLPRASVSAVCVLLPCILPIYVEAERSTNEIFACCGELAFAMWARASEHAPSETDNFTTDSFERLKVPRLFVLCYSALKVMKLPEGCYSSSCARDTIDTLDAQFKHCMTNDVIDFAKVEKFIGSCFANKTVL